MTLLHITLNQAKKFRTSNYQIGLKKNADARGTWSTLHVQNFLIMLNNFLQMNLKLLQQEQLVRKSDLIGNRIANKITKSSPQSYSENH